MKFRITPGSEAETVTPSELDQALARYAALASEREQLKGIKALRFRSVGTVASSAVTIGGDSASDAGGTQCGPEQGYVWSIRHLVVRGLTRGTTPDVLQFFVNNASGFPLWELNGNVWAQTFGRGEIVLFQGETLFAQNQGTFAATGNIFMRGMAENIPAEMIGKFF